MKDLIGLFKTLRSLGLGATPRAISETLAATEAARVYFDYYDYVDVAALATSDRNLAILLVYNKRGTNKQCPVRVQIQIFEGNQISFKNFEVPERVLNYLDFKCN